MLDLRSILFVLTMASVLNQPVVAYNEFSIEEMKECGPVGKIEMKITKLQRMGYERELIETSLKRQLDENLSLWIAPITKLVFSSQNQSTEKVIRKAIGYCMHTMKMHKKGHITKHVEA